VKKWNALFTVLLLLFVGKCLHSFVEWAFDEAVWRPDSGACRAAAGACWGFIADKYRFILFGTYPYDEHWRPALATLLLVALWALSGWRQLWKPRLIILWVIGLLAIGALMWGGVLGLPYVENGRWGGLILTLLLFTFGVAFAFPLAILLALARRDGLPALRALAVGYIELVRGVPLISLLFMASVMLPLFLPAGMTIDKLLRAQAALILFAAAYLAEVVRGGLQAIPREQYEAADALGLTYWQRARSVVLPQALKIALPPLVSTFIGFFKSTSLVVVIGLFDFLSTVKVSLSDPKWAGFGVEAYLFTAVVYFAFCYAMSLYSRRLERG
jgi:general L-amino acid transport system permease protein